MVNCKERRKETGNIGHSNCAIKTEQIAKSKADEKIRLSYVPGMFPGGTVVASIVFADE